MQSNVFLMFLFLVGKYYSLFPHFILELFQFANFSVTWLFYCQVRSQYNFNSNSSQFASQ